MKKKEEKNERNIRTKEIDHLFMKHETILKNVNKCDSVHDFYSFFIYFFSYSA